MTDNLTAEQRAFIESFKIKRRAITNPAARIAFDNDPANGPFALRVIALSEVTVKLPPTMTGRERGLA